MWVLPGKKPLHKAKRSRKLELGTKPKEGVAYANQHQRTPCRTDRLT